MMTVMTSQPPLLLMPESARPIGAAAAIVEDDAGGRVFVHGNLGLCLGWRRSCGASVRGGVADADQGRYPTRGR